jgi:hypothetical protein
MSGADSLGLHRTLLKIHDNPQDTSPVFFHTLTLLNPKTSLLSDHHQPYSIEPLTVFPLLSVLIPAIDIFPLPTKPAHPVVAR